MTRAVLRSLLLELRRDRGALVMTFVLPVIFFLVFAWIFAGSGGGDAQLRLAVADTTEGADASRLLDALAAEDGVRIAARRPDAEAVRALVGAGKVDVGLVLRGDLRRPRGEPPILVLHEPTRSVAASMLLGRVQRAYVEALPDAALGGLVAMLDARFLDLDDEQRARLEAGLASLRESGGPGAGDPFGAIHAREVVAAAPRDTSQVTYYAGAVAILFLLFSAVHGAITLLAERDAGILDRVLAGPAGTRVLVDARFLFLAALGFVQVTVIYLVAWLGYGVDLPGHLLGWAATTLAVALCAAGLALALVTATGSQRQAQTAANVAILIVSAVGGSMVPRFFMPPLLQDLGWLTPNTWGLEAYAGVFWRGASVTDLLLPLGLLVGAGVAGLLLARRLARRWEVL